MIDPTATDSSVQSRERLLKISAVNHPGWPYSAEVADIDRDLKNVASKNKFLAAEDKFVCRLTVDIFVVL